MDLHNSKLLIFTLSIPVIAILIFAAVFYLPQFFAEDPQYNFLYYIENNTVSARVDVNVDVRRGKVFVEPKERYIDTLYKNEQKSLGKFPRSYVSDSDRKSDAYQKTYDKALDRLNTLATESESSNLAKNDFPVRFFIYNVDTKGVTEVSYSEARKINLYYREGDQDDFYRDNYYYGDYDYYNYYDYENRSSYYESPDGFKILCGQQVLLFDSYSDCSKLYLKGNGKSIELKHFEGRRWIRNQFLGWIVSESGILNN